jgi:hypothetical protein
LDKIFCGGCIVPGANWLRKIHLALISNVNKNAVKKPDRVEMGEGDLKWQKFKLVVQGALLETILLDPSGPRVAMIIS